MVQYFKFAFGGEIKWCNVDYRVIIVRISDFSYAVFTSVLPCLINRGQIGR